MTRTGREGGIEASFERTSYPAIYQVEGSSFSTSRSSEVWIYVPLRVVFLRTHSINTGIRSEDEILLTNSFVRTLRADRLHHSLV